MFRRIYFYNNFVVHHFVSRTSFEAGQHWNLVVLFCRVHKMEFPVEYLQDCAKADKWLPFVCHAQACQFPKEQVIILSKRLHVALISVKYTSGKVLCVFTYFSITVAPTTTPFCKYENLQRFCNNVHLF